MALVARREDRAYRPRIEVRHQLGGAGLQGVTIGGWQKVFQHQEAIARICLEVGRAHWTTRSRTTGRSPGALSPGRVRRGVGSTGASAWPALAAGTMHNGLPARPWAPTSMTSLRPTDASIASSAWLRPPPSATTAMPTSRAFIPTTWAERWAVHGFMTGACER